MAHVADHLSFATLADLEYVLPSAVAVSIAISSNPGQPSTGGPSQTSRPNAVSANIVWLEAMWHPAEG